MDSEIAYIWFELFIFLILFDSYIYVDCVIYIFLD